MTSGDATEPGLYAKHEKVYPRYVKGRYQSLRNLAVLTLLGLYYLVPWLRWEGRQAVLFDMPARQFHILGLTFWPQDFFYLAGLLIIAALALFFFTALAGRLWCGYACPQTVWTEAFIWMERLVEGDRNKRIKLDKGPTDRHKVLLKTIKHTLWIAFSLWTGFTFVGYFTPITELAAKVATFSTGPWETFWILFYGFATYGNAGWMREQVCIYMCPYARFQSAMFDRNTLIVSYDTARGEPRGGRKKNIDPAAQGLGDCVDCTLCVQVCPTGIDIRDGLQYQCIGCAACVDVCNSVMDKMGYDRGLVRYTTENELEGKQTRVFRPRVMIYGALLSVITLAMLIGIFSRSPLELDVIRDRNALYREAVFGVIENVYTLKIINKSDAAQTYTFSVSGLPDARIVIDDPLSEVASGEVAEVFARVEVPRDNLSEQSSSIEITIAAERDPAMTATEEARFVGPRDL